MKLRRCPFCGSKADSHVDGNGWGNERVTCTGNKLKTGEKCGATIEGDAPCAGKFYKEVAPKSWNRRHGVRVDVRASLRRRGIPVNQRGRKSRGDPR